MDSAKPKFYSAKSQETTDDIVSDDDEILAPIVFDDEVADDNGRCYSFYLKF